MKSADTFISLRDRLELKDGAAAWFHEKTECAEGSRKEHGRRDKEI